MRALLKTRTQQIHDTVDAAFSTLDLTSRAGYCQFLSAHFLAYSTLARGNAALSSSIGDATTQLRDLLAADLGTLGVESPGSDGAGLAPALHPLGVGYVIGGSHYGKRVLQKRWSKSADSTVQATSLYLGSDLPARVWVATLAGLDHVDSGAEAAREIIDSAIATFDLFHAAYLSTTCQMTRPLQHDRNTRTRQRK